MRDRRCALLTMRRAHCASRPSQAANGSPTPHPHPHAHTRPHPRPPPSSFPLFCLLLLLFQFFFSPHPPSSPPLLLLLFPLLCCWLSRLKARRLFEEIDAEVAKQIRSYGLQPFPFMTPLGLSAMHRRQQQAQRKSGGTSSSGNRFS